MIISDFLLNHYDNGEGFMLLFLLNYDCYAMLLMLDWLTTLFYMLLAFIATFITVGWLLFVVIVLQIKNAFKIEWFGTILSWA